MGLFHFFLFFCVSEESEVVMAARLETTTAACECAYYEYKSSFEILFKNKKKNKTLVQVLNQLN